MASINHIVSEVANAMGDAYNPVLRAGIREAVIHDRAEKIRHSYERHKVMDDVLMQRYNVSLVQVPDGDLQNVGIINMKLKVYRTNNKLPKAIRLSNNLPFQSISFLGANYGRTISKFNEKLMRFHSQSSVLRSSFMGYDYINGYIYIFSDKELTSPKINVRAAFELPNEISTETVDGVSTDDNEFLIPEDIVSSIFDTVFRRYYLDVRRDAKVENQTV